MPGLRFIAAAAFILARTSLCLKPSVAIISPTFGHPFTGTMDSAGSPFIWLQHRNWRFTQVIMIEVALLT
jgi:hypothetical protein